MKKQSIILGAAIAGLMVAGTTLSHTANAKDEACVGANACKGKSACKGGANNSCKGQNACKGQGVAMMSKKKCADWTKKHEAEAAKPAAEGDTH